MEKIQMDAALAVQASMAASRYSTADASADFSKLLKGQNGAADAKKNAAAAAKPDGSSPGKAAKPVKGEQAGKAEEPSKAKAEETEKPEETGQKDAVSAELLLQLQETAGLMMTEPAQDVSAAPEQAAAAETVDEVSAEILPETPLNIGQTRSVEQTAGPVQNEAQPETAETVRTQAAVNQPVKEGVDAPELKTDRPVEQSKPLQPSETEAQAQAQTPESPVTPVRAQTETPTGNASENKTREEAPQPQYTGVHLQLRNYSVGEMDRTVSTPVRTTEADLVNDVGRTLAERMPRTDGTLTIELEPASLGKLTIQVLYEAGRATVSILSTNPRTLELLSQRAGELATILEERTGQETVVYTEQPQSEQPYDERQREGQHRDQEQEEREQKERGTQESFAQQLRLGLV